MGKLVVVEGDPVSGTDTHNVSGMGPNPAAPPPTAAYAGVGDYKYSGAITDQLSDFVTINSTAVALVSSQSSLNAGETAPTGGHGGPSGSNFVAGASSVALTPTATTLQITDSPLGTGVPNTGAGSALLTVNSKKVLLDGDKIDTCSGTGATADSSVAAQGQDFVTCSG